MLQHCVRYRVWTGTGAFTVFQGKEEFIQRKLSVVVRVYASCGKVWDSEFPCLLMGKEGRVIICVTAGMVEMLGYCVGDGCFVIYYNIVDFQCCNWCIWFLVI